MSDNLWSSTDSKHSRPLRQLISSFLISSNQEQASGTIEWNQSSTGTASNITSLLKSLWGSCLKISKNLLPSCEQLASNKWLPYNCKVANCRQIFLRPHLIILSCCDFPSIKCQGVKKVFSNSLHSTSNFLKEFY